MTATQLAVADTADTQEIATQSVGAIMTNAPLLDRLDTMAKRMATAKATIPQHLKGSEGDCWAVCMQAIQWRMNPYAVAQKTHVVNGSLGYEAQLVNAVVTSMAPTKDRINYEWFGDWTGVDGKQSNDPNLGVRIWATMKGEDAPRELVLSMAQVGTVRNSPLWVADPRQQIAYLAVKRWARLHCPDVILGVYTPDELHETKEREIGPGAARPADPVVNRSEALADQLADAEPEAIEVEPEVPETAGANMTFAEVCAAINGADSVGALEDAGSLIEEFLAYSNNARFRNELKGVYRARKKSITDAETPE